MKHNLRKFVPLLFLAVISFAVILPSAVFVAPQVAQAQSALAPPTLTTPPAPAAAPAPAAKPAGASPSVVVGFLQNTMLQAIGALIQFVINTLGLLTIALIHILLLVAGYNDYMNSPAITTGWVVVRDVANLFFVAIILVVSIGSIVNPGRFGGVKQVFKILLFALLVNFSRTIAGLFIDISQLVMLTFVNGFAQAAGGNFVEALGISKINDVAPGTAALDFASMMGALVIALLMMIIITVIIAVLVVALTVRMVTLWMLVVLSPLAFALGASDMTHEHYATWWKKFSAELTTGPIVAFFLWLSLVSFQNSSGSDIVAPSGLSDKGTAGNENTSVDCGATTACTQENLIRFVVAACMLLMGLGFAKEFSGVGGSLAGAALSKGKSYAMGATKWAARKSAPVAAGALVGGPIGAGVMLASRSKWVKKNVGESLSGGNRVGNAINKIPLLNRVTNRAGLALTASANKEYAESAKKADEKVKAANPQQLVAMSKGNGVDNATQMAAKVAAAAKPTKDTGWQDADKGKALNEAEAYYKSTNNKSGLDEIEKQRKKNPLLVDENEPATDGKSKNKRDQIVKKMSGSDLLELDPKSLNEEIVGFMTPNQREHIKKNGGGERETIIDDWEAKNPPTPNKLADDLKTGTQKADSVNEHSLENVDIAVRLSADDLKGKLNEILKTPAKKESFKRGVENALKGAPNNRLDSSTNRYSADSQQAAEGLARAGGGIAQTFRANPTTGDFDNVATAKADEEALIKALRGKNGAEVALSVKRSQFKGKVKDAILANVDMSKLGSMKQIAVNDEDSATKMEIVNAIAEAKHAELEIKAAAGDKKAERSKANLEKNYDV